MGSFRIPRRESGGIVSANDDLVGFWATFSYQRDP